MKNIPVPTDVIQVLITLVTSFTIGFILALASVYAQNENYRKFESCSEFLNQQACFEKYLLKEIVKVNHKEKATGSLTGHVALDSNETHLQLGILMGDRQWILF